MSCHHIDFVALHLAFQNHRSAAIDDPLTELLDHRPSVILIDIKFLSDLQSRQVQSRKIQACDLCPQRLMMSREDGIGQIVEALVTTFAFVTLTVGLSVIATVLDDRVRAAMRTDYAVRPSHIPDGLVALGVVDEVLNIYHRRTPRVPNRRRGRADHRPDTFIRF